MRYRLCPLDWIVQCFTSPPTQYRLYGRRFYRSQTNQQYQSTEGTHSTQKNQTYNKQTWTQNTARPLVYSNMGWLGDGSHRGQGCQAWTAVGLPPQAVSNNTRKQQCYSRLIQQDDIGQIIRHKSMEWWCHDNWGISFLIHAGKVLSRWSRPDHEHDQLIMMSCYEAGSLVYNTQTHEHNI